MPNSWRPRCGAVALSFLWFMRLRLPRNRILLWYYCAIAMAVVLIGWIAASQWIGARQSSQGTVLLMAAARTPSHYRLDQVALHSSSGWQTLSVHFDGRVASAPTTTSLARPEVASGDYDAIRVGNQVTSLQVTVSSTEVEPILVSVQDGRAARDGVYAGDSQVSLGINELAGRLSAISQFSLVDQNGRPFTNASLRGKVAIIAAFHTNCHETCPLYTGLFLQLARHLPKGVMLVEATVDPQVDTPAVLEQYKQMVGADWTFATGSVQQMQSFWQPFGVQLSNGDVHTSELVVIDAHGYIRSTYQGVPDVGSSLPGPLARQLNAQGESEFQSHGNGWGVTQLLNTLQAVDRPYQVSTNGGGQAPAFSATTPSGGRIRLSQFEGKPLLIDFWASWCDACRQEMPLIQQAAAQHPGMRVLLVDEQDNAAAARTFMSQLKITLPVAVDPDGRIGATYGLIGMPTSVFVLPNGTIASRYPGAMDPSTLASNLAGLGLT
jgi:cytochrome oxidase Cu insertion factor (SCO1/SenC/PrrC family)